MPRENNRIYEKTLASSNNLEKNINFFCEIGKVKNIEYSTNNWTHTIEIFYANKNYKGKLEEISDIKQVYSGKIKYLTDLKYGLYGEEHFYLMAEDFKKREDGGYDVFIYRSKTNQRIEIGNCEKADKLILLNNPDIIEVYEKDLSYCPQLAQPNFYLQECDE
ncbi:hypothetical protein C1645_821038 [Glomus cerebriforme]|uniref:Uncharacterized protein n=1 Tax=Glomus cerebriforme TaxID=658196 RepID=A0A397T2V5_9GLOM|nr:hypothetical protein C1645_821038 [Glomus cerebriforme]